MSVESQFFWLPRHGNSAMEYEDAAAADDVSRRYAVADGASEGCFTGAWARLLVDDFVRNPDVPIEDWPKSLVAVQKEWDRNLTGRQLPYHAEPWVRKGAFAAFLGFNIAPVGNGAYQWQAIAVGDTCLFHTRGATLLQAFPLENSKLFGNAPPLVGARATEDEVRRRCAFWSFRPSLPGDRLWAMTDALAQWCLSEHETGENPWGELEHVLIASFHDSYFAEWIGGLRNSRKLRNDDVTLLTVRLTG